MSRRLHRLWLLPALLLASHAWALGLGDIRLDSALNEPLRAEIELLSATTEELKNLEIRLASVDTFARYDLDRPHYLTNIDFEIVTSGTGSGDYVRLTSSDPITEPFITFLVEAVWSRGRLLREYTLLLDPPTFVPPAISQSTPVTAPTQVTESDRGQIERPAPAPAPVAETRPAPAPPQATPRPTQAPSTPEPAPSVPEPEPSMQEPEPSMPEPEPMPAMDNFDTAPGGDLVVQRGDTLWSIAQRMNPDARLSTNQVMLAIYEANPDAFAGNINMMSAGASLRIPSADEVYSISRADALAEVVQHNERWSGVSDDFGVSEPALTLVPPDEDIDLFDDEPVEPVIDDTFAEDVDPDAARIDEIETAIADHQNSLITISDAELAALRTELAALRGEPLPEPAMPEPEPAPEPDPFVDDSAVVDDATADDSEAVVDDAAMEPEPAVEEEPAPAPQVAAREPEPGMLDTILGYLTGIWGIIGGALLVAVGALVWFARRPKDVESDDNTGMWEALDEEVDDIEAETMASTERLRAMARDDDSAIVVVEQESDPLSMADTMEVPAAPEPEPAADDPFTATAANEAAASADELDLDLDFDTGEPAEDAVAAPVAEAPEPAPAPLAPTPAPQPSLEDTFSSETAINLDQSDPIAEADFHMAYGLYDQAADLINGALEVESDREDLLSKLCEIYFVWGNRDAFIDAAGRMHKVSGGQSNPEWDKIVIMGQQIASDHELFSGMGAGAATREIDLEFGDAGDDDGMLDLDFAESADADVVDLGEATAEVPAVDATAELDIDLDDASVTQEVPMSSDTAELPATSDTVETPAIEEQFASLDDTGALPGVELGPDDMTEVASLDDLDSPDKPLDATAEIDLDDLGLDLDGLDDVSIGDDDNLAETGRNPALAEVEPSMLDATGQTSILDESALSDDDKTMLADPLGDDDKTMLAPSPDDDDAPQPAADLETLVAPLDDDDEATTMAEDTVSTAMDGGGLDLAATAEMPVDAFGSDSSTDETGEMPGIPGSTDMDLDLDDLTAALQVSEVGDTIESPHPGSDATVEQPLIRPEDVDGGDDLNDARTMTEVGTKLDLARAYVDMGDPGGARSILEEVLDEGDEGQRQQAQQLLETLPS